MSSATADNKGPSEKAKTAVANVIAIVEGCDPQDRGYLLNRLAQIYYGAKGAKDIRAALNVKSAASKKASSKKSWKEAWHATPEYREWQQNIADHKSDDAAAKAANAETYNRLRADAFRVRDRLKAQDESPAKEEEETPAKFATTGDSYAATAAAPAPAAPKGNPKEQPGTRTASSHELLTALADNRTRPGANKGKRR